MSLKLLKPCIDTLWWLFSQVFEMVIDYKGNSSYVHFPKACQEPVKILQKFL